MPSLLWYHNTPLGIGTYREQPRGVNPRGERQTGENRAGISACETGLRGAGFRWPFRGGLGGGVLPAGSRFPLTGPKARPVGCCGGIKPNAGVAVRWGQNQCPYLAGGRYPRFGPLIRSLPACLRREGFICPDPFGQNAGAGKAARNRQQNFHFQKGRTGLRSVALADVQQRSANRMWRITLRPSGAQKVFSSGRNRMPLACPYCRAKSRADAMSIAVSPCPPPRGYRPGPADARTARCWRGLFLAADSTGSAAFPAPLHKPAKGGLGGVRGS